MNASKKVINQIGYLKTFNNIDSSIEHIFTKPLVMYSNSIYQIDDYSKYKADIFSEEERSVQRKIQFPLDCQKAFELGTNLIK